MISRRQLIGCGVAAAALGVASGSANTIESFVRPGPRIALLVVDERYDVARMLARSLAAPDIRRVALPRDVLDLWHQQLALVCRSGRHAIAGITTERGFFLLHTLAADHRMRVLSRAVHAAPRTDHEPLVSWLFGPK
jgi:hypothetical protein